MLSVDENAIRNGMAMRIAAVESQQVQRIVVDGMDVEGDSLFLYIGEGQTCNVEIITPEGTTTGALQFTSLPIFTLQGGPFGYEYSEAALTVQERGEQPESMRAKVKWRGGSTNSVGRHKRNYKLSFIDASGQKEDHSFGGLRSDNQWVLDAGQVDLFRMRNLVMSRLWNDFACPPYYIAQQPKALTATRGQMVEVFCGNEYQGVYNLCEPIDRKQMRLKKFDADGTIHGGLWKASGFGDATFFNVPKEYDNTLPKNDVWEVKYPEVEDLCPTDYSTLRNAILFVVTSSDEDFCRQVSDYFDLPVLVDYYLFVNVGNLFDICGKNVYWAVYDKVADKKLTPAMWDLDCAMGQNFVDDPLRPSWVAPDYEPMFPTNLLYRLYCLNPDCYNETVKSRYWALRQTVFSTDSLQSRYQEVYDEMRVNGVLMREAQRWSGDSDIAGLTLDFEAELQYIHQWIDQRMAYLDDFFATSYAAIEELHPVPAVGENRVWDLQGIMRRDGVGIRLQNGRKVLCR